MLANLRRYFLSGLIIFLPLALTLNLFLLMIQFADSILGQYIEPLIAREFGFYVRGLSIIIAVLIILIIGFLARNFVGKALFHNLERLLLRLPFFRQVYPAIKEISVFLFNREKIAFQKVVVVEYPRKGIYTIGFLTNEAPEKVDKMLGVELYNVFIPTTPSPFSGFLILVKKEEVMFVDLSVEDALRLIVSGGVVNP